MSDESVGSQNEDPVGEVLRGLSEALNVTPEHGWSRGTQSAVLEALEDAVRPHQRYDAPWGVAFCQLDQLRWPCPTYRQVQDTLEGLL